MAPTYKVVETSEVSAESLEQILNEWSARGWRFEMMHFAMREQAIGAVGQVQTQQIEAYIIERLRKPFGDLVGKWPPS